MSQKTFTSIKDNPEIKEKLFNELTILYSTELGRTSITERYGALQSPSTIIEILTSAVYGVVLEFENKIVGYGDITNSKSDDTKQIGYLIFPQYTGQGLGFALAEHIMAYAQANSINIKGEAETTNTASCAILKKLAEMYVPNKSATNNSFDPPTMVVYWNFDTNSQ